PKFQRVLLKLSGEALLGEREYGIDPLVCEYIAKEIQQLIKNKIEVVVVFGGGNIFRGISAEKHGMKRVTGDYIGMLATVMNSLALGSALTKIEIENRVQSALDMSKVCESYIRNRAIRHLEKGRVVIVAAGSGHPYFSTDTAAAVRACELDCEVVLKATKVDGVYNADPQKDKTAKKFQTLTYLDVINNDYKVMDSTAITLCKDNHIPILVFKLMEKDNILKVCQGKKIGTVIHS
ncbi:MAG: UMP kinase, partial [Candidatus Berkelbacteria bacterium]